MSRESKKVKPLREKELDLVVGGVGAFTNNFMGQFQIAGLAYTASDGMKYTPGIDMLNPTPGGYFLMIAVSPTGSGPQAGWNFKFGFPDQSWANTYAGGAADFKAAFIGLYGSAKWKGWSSTATAKTG